MPARHHRVTRGDDYRRIVRTGNRVGGAFCITYAVRRSSVEHGSAVSDGGSAPQSAPIREELPARFGYIIAKNVGNAVTRNLVRRRMKAVSEQLIHHGMNGVEIVFRAHPAAATAPFAELEREMRDAATRLTERLTAQRSAGKDRNIGHGESS